MFNDNLEILPVSLRSLERQELECRRNRLRSKLEDSTKAVRHINKDQEEHSRIMTLEERKAEFNSLPLKLRKIYTAIGWSPYDADKIVRRSTGSLEIKKI